MCCVIPALDAGISYPDVIAGLDFYVIVGLVFYVIVGLDPTIYIRKGIPRSRRGMT